MQGSRNNSALLWAPEKAGVTQPLLILSLIFFFCPCCLQQCLSSKQTSAEGTEACTNESATMSPVGTDDTLRIRMECTIAWLFVILYP